MFSTEIRQDITRRMESYKSWKEGKVDDALFHAITEEEFEGESSLHWLVQAYCTLPW
jgi:hypothetical protein